MLAVTWGKFIAQLTTYSSRFSVNKAEKVAIKEILNLNQNQFICLSLKDIGSRQVDPIDPSMIQGELRI